MKKRNRGLINDALSKTANNSQPRAPSRNTKLISAEKAWVVLKDVADVKGRLSSLCTPQLETGTGGLRIEVAAVVEVKGGSDRGKEGKVIWTNTLFLNKKQTEPHLLPLEVRWTVRDAKLKRGGVEPFSCYTRQGHNHSTRPQCVVVVLDALTVFSQNISTFSTFFFFFLWNCAGLAAVSCISH